MPYVPPHKRAGASSSGSEPPSGTAAGHAGSAPGSESRFGRGRGRGRGQAGGRGKNHAANKISIKNSRDVVLATVIDDYAERESSVTGTPCSSSCACNGGKSRCNRMRLRFQPFKGRSYLHLQGQNLSLLKRAPDSDVDHIESPEIEYTPPPADSPSFATSAAPTAIPATPATIHPASDASASAAFPLPITTPASLFDAVAGPLLKGLEAAHKEMEFAAQSQLRKSSLDRCKLVVRLGKLLFGPPFGSPESLLPGLPPFTAGAFESNLNRQAQRLPVRVHRSLETGMPEPLFQAVEGIVMGGEGGSVQTKETYHIRVVDTDQMDTEYKLICKPDPDGSGVILVKVKHNPLRYAVVDVSRPAKAIDFRLMLATDTRLCSLDEATQSACERIASSAIIEDSSKGGLHWPITVDFDVGMKDAPSPAHSPSAHSSSHAPAHSPASPSHRFRVRSVRHQRRLRVQSGGQLWKLSRVNGVEFDHGGGRLTNEVEFTLLPWRQQMKATKDAHNDAAASPSPLSSEPTPTSYLAASCFDSSLQQAAPQWTPESILAECPALIDWLQQHLP